MIPTREQILNEPAGKQMDAWVAEFVMGWKLIVDEFRSYWATEEGAYQHHIASEDSYEDDEDFELINWHPSEGYLAAMEVIEKLKFDDFSIGINNYWGKQYWQVQIGKEHGAVHKDESLPLAICRAALMAKVLLLKMERN